MVLFAYINIRTFTVLILSVISCYLSIQYSITLHFNIVLFSLAIVFPLATSIQMAFKRREKALEYLSLFKSGLLAIHYSLQSSKKLEEAKKAEAIKMLNDVSDKLLQQLKTSDGNMAHFKEETDKVMSFVHLNREFISARILIRVIRYLKDCIDGAAYLLSLTTHRTMIGLRIFSIFFIHLFAVMHSPMVVEQLRNQMPYWSIYMTTAVGPLLLITLYNFQIGIEYPFDQKGADDIKLDEFKLNI